LFYLLARVFLQPGDDVVQSEHGFLVYGIASKLCGAEVRIAKDAGLFVDVDAMLASVGAKTKIVWLANPNNPTGTSLPIAEVRRLHAGLRSDVLLVLDGAYAEYVQRNDYEAGLELVAEHDNVVMTRTFSKIHGLAALRVGWAYAPPTVVDALNRTRGPFNVPGPALAAAIAAIGDAGFVQRSIEHNGRELPRVRAALLDLGFDVPESDANFILVHFADVAERTAADAHLRARGLVVRAVEAYGLPRSLRITIGLESDNDRVIAALQEFAEGRASP
jgi:histidinol-phosphate aminotransferase